MRKSAQRITLIKDITLAIADCKYRAPLPPRLYDRFLLYYKFFHFSRCFLIYFLSDCDDFCFAGHGAMWHRPLQGTGGVRCFLSLAFARHGRCQMFFCCWHLHGRRRRRIFFCLRFCRHRPLHNIFCDIVGDDAHIVPSADRHTADRHTADRQSHRVREQRHRRLTTNHCRGRCPHRPVFLFFGNKKDGLKTVFFHHHTDNSASSPRTSLYLSKTGET